MALQVEPCAVVVTGGRRGMGAEEVDAPRLVHEISILLDTLVMPWQSCLPTFFRCRVGG
jgi:hypothetical protein